MRESSGTAGFTVVEVLVAITVLGVGILGMLGTSALVTRTLGESRRQSTATAVAEQRVETLRQLARARTTPCTATGFGSGGPVTTQGVVEEWFVTTNAGNASLRDVRVLVSVRNLRGVSSYSVRTTILCQ